MKRLGDLISGTFRETDVCCRLGGDEFVVAGKGDEATLLTAIERLQQQASVPVTSMSPAMPLEYSLGYTLSRRGSQFSLQELVEKADTIMYQAKRKKKEANILSILTPPLGVLTSSAA